MISQIQQVLTINRASEAWAGDQDVRGRSIERYRRYMDGEFDSQMTTEMRQLMRLRTDEEFGANYCHTVVSTMADRLRVAGIEADTDVGKEWIDDLLKRNRFDALQVNCHEAALRDGVTYLLVDYDNEAQRVRWTHEQAYDGMDGMVVVYESTRSIVPTLAVKIWKLTTHAYADTLRFNVYHADRIERYQSLSGGTPGLIDDGPLPWTDREGQPLGVPVIPFINRQRGNGNEGLSELENVISLQNMLNRALYSMTMTAELSAFQVRWAKGFNPPNNLTPGSWIKIGSEGLTADDVAEIGTLDQGEIMPYVEQSHFIIEQIFDVSSTPYYRASSNASGEALKQREIGLLGKVRRAQIKFGNAWEDAAYLSHRIQDAYGQSRPPAVETFNTAWDEAEVRNDKEAVETIMQARDLLGDELTMRKLAPVLGLTEDEIQQALEARRAETDRIIAGFGGNIPALDTANFIAQTEDENAIETQEVA